MDDPFASLPRDPRDPSYADLRAADRDRDVVLQVLGEAYADGRLTREEYDERSETLAGTRTLGGLAELLSDLVPPTVSGSADLVRAGSTSPTRPDDLRVEAVRHYERQRREAVWGMLSASIVCLVIWAVVSGFGSFFWPGFVVLGTGINVARLVVRRSDVVDDRVAELEKKQRRALEREQRRAERDGS